MFGSIVCHWLYVYSKVSFHGFKSYWIDFFSFLKKRKCWDIFGHSPKGQKKSKWFFQAEVSSKKPTIEFYFTTMKPYVDLFSFIFFGGDWRRQKRHFKINWPLAKGWNLPTDLWWEKKCNHFQYDSTPWRLTLVYPLFSAIRTL